MEDTNTISLTEEEKLHLFDIYQTRHRFFFRAFSGILLMAVMASMKIDMRPIWTDNVIAWNSKQSDNLVETRSAMYLVNFFFLTSIISIPSYAIYRKRIHAFKKDFKKGEAELVSFIITNKLYFDQTGECFFSLNHPKYLHYQTTEAEFHAHDIGEPILIKKSTYAGYMFDSNLSFSII